MKGSEDGTAVLVVAANMAKLAEQNACMVARCVGSRRSRASTESRKTPSFCSTAASRRAPSHGSGASPLSCALTCNRGGHQR